MGERCICRKRENCPCPSTLWVSSGLLGVTRFAARLLPGPAETGVTFKSFPSHPRRVSLFSFSPTLLAAGASPSEGEGALPRAPCSGLSLPVAGLAGEPGGGHGTRPCDGVRGGCARWPGAGTPGSHPRMPGGRKRSLPLRLLGQHPAW